MVIEPAAVIATTTETTGATGVIAIVIGIEIGEIATGIATGIVNVRSHGVKRNSIRGSPVGLRIDSRHFTEQYSA